MSISDSLKILAISRLPSYLPISPNLQNRRARVQWGIWRPSRDARRVRHKYPSMEIGVRRLVAGMLQRCRSHYDGVLTQEVDPTEGGKWERVDEPMACVCGYNGATLDRMFGEP